MTGKRAEGGMWWRYEEDSGARVGQKAAKEEKREKGRRRENRALKTTINVKSCFLSISTCKFIKLKYHVTLEHP